MSDPYIVLEFPDGQRVAQRVVHGTTLEDLEDLWPDAWLDYCVGHDQRIRVGLGHGTLYRSQFQGALSEAVKRLSTTWLGYRDAKWPATDNGGDIPWPSSEETAEINRRNVEAARAERVERFAIIEWPDAERAASASRYADWYSRTHDELIARASAIGLIAPGETFRLGWVDRDRETGEAEYTWLDGERVA